MTYSLQIRKLAIRMIEKNGIIKTSIFTKISRSTLWRWKTNGINPKKRIYESELFNKIQNILKELLIIKKCINAKEISIYFKEHHNIKISTRTIYKFIKKIKFSRKRIRTRGICKGDLNALKQFFCSKYKQSIVDNKILVSIDECAFSEKLNPIYGYSPIGEPVVIKINGSWVHHSLLMAVFSNGTKAFTIKKGSIKRTDFISFIDSLKLNNDSMIIIDNASIHKKLELSTNPLICYTPPYSPEFNAIELCFGKIKGIFRKLNITSNANISNLISLSIEKLLSSEIISCFNHVSTNFII
jgi:transposase